MAARKKPASDPVPALEWAAATLGLLVVLALLVILGREVGRGAVDDAPLLSTRIEAVTQTPTGHVAQIVVINKSGQTAAAVQVEGKLGEEESSATLDYVPGHSEARGGLLFQADPRGGQLELRVTGYELP
ncbi:MAG TPA: hypothetical protein VNA29_01735 [Sphingomicrobium sp.]|nr:hypothetical protein [Sphingomicrobium sp.]